MPSEYYKEKVGIGDKSTIYTHHPSLLAEGECR